ncbi:MAG: hypothetical protein PGN37_13545 [Mycobacterium kyogaense]|uniref:hypothetical protein n=1 Tax=Mycobacterium kyogaense TaxID=2212479 RepID=UPI002FF5C042
MPDITPDFELIDAPRPIGNSEFQRVVADHFGYVEPYLEELDKWCALPVRLVHNSGAGWHLELGCYDLDAADIHTLRAAIRAYDDAVSR